MKRILSLLTALLLCATLVGCSVLDYYEAGKLYKEGQFAQAQALYESLGDYADSPEMAGISAQKATYELAEERYTAGAYGEAAELYDSLGMYADSPLKAVQSRYEGGKACLAAGDYAQAIAFLLQVGSYEDSMDLVNQARWLWVGQARCTKVLQADSTDYAAISLEPKDQETLGILLEKKGLLLGLPYETEFYMTLVRNQPEAAYTLSYTTTNVTTIAESAAGNVTLRAFSDGLPVTEFTQKLTDAEGNVTESTETADAIMMQSVMAEVIAEINRELPALLEKTGAEVTMADLGF